MRMRLPDKDEHRRQWAAVDVDTRRAVMRAVNRGNAMETKPDAKLAVGVARQQQRFWSRVWVIAPLTSLLFFDDGWAQIVANAVFATLFMGALAGWWFLRARKAERANLEVLGVSPEEAKRPAAQEPADDLDPEAGDGRAGMPHAANPPKRSRRKRR